MTSHARIVYDHFDAIDRNLVRGVDRVIGSIATDISQDANRGAPHTKATRHAPKPLRSSYAAEQIEQCHWRAATPNWYAALVEFGASQAPARPHLVPAAERARHTLVSRLSGIEDDLQ